MIWDILVKFELLARIFAEYAIIVFVIVWACKNK
jgi:hypothetical protein